MNKVTAFMSRIGKKAKLACSLGAVSAVTALATVCASAEGSTTSLSTYSDQITSQFTSAANDIAPIIVGVLGAGLGIFVIFVGIRLAKKMFSTVSKG